MEKNLYSLAQEDLNNDEDFTVLAFKQKYRLESGFYKKPIEFFYWLYKKENNSITENIFKQSFIGRMIKFDKKNIPNYTELVIEYEKERLARSKRQSVKSKKTKIKRLSEARQNKINKS